MPRRKDIKKVLVIGSGPIVIGQAAEFDYAGTQACLALKEEGYEVILANSNPATIMTDTHIADKVYMEPLTLEYVAKIIRFERPDAIVPGLGGQTGLNLAVQLAKKGILKECQVEILGTSFESIERAEDRELFKELCESLGEPVLPSHIAMSIEEAVAVAEEIGYPVVLRPAFTLGGTGGGFADDETELREMMRNALSLSPVHQVLVEKSIKGYKEIEYEVMRDRNDTAICICCMENIDPVGIHTGDSIVVAPSQTLTNKEFQMLRDSALKIIRELKIEGGCNVQFALDPLSFKYYLIEVNPRVSRSSALASKASGYPIARVSAKIAVGLTLDEIRIANTPASFEPTLDYIVTKVARFPFDKFSDASNKLGTQMKATGEVMSIGRTMEESLLKAVRSLETGVCHIYHKKFDKWSNDDLLAYIKGGTDDRLYAIGQLIRNGVDLALIYDKTKIDMFFLEKFKNIVEFENVVRAHPMDVETLRAAKRMGFSDKYIGQLWGLSQNEMYRLREKNNVFPVYKMIDTCASEFASYVPYFYSTYEEENESIVSGKEKIIVLGSGPIRIGQGVEFDYSTVHAIWSIRAAGYEAIIINNNPETVSTDYTTSDKLYFEPSSISRNRRPSWCRSADRRPSTSPNRSPSWACLSSARTRRRSRTPRTAAASRGSWRSWEFRSPRPRPLPTSSRASGPRRASAIRCWCVRATCWAAAPCRSSRTRSACATTCKPPWRSTWTSRCWSTAISWARSWRWTPSATARRSSSPASWSMSSIRVSTRATRSASIRPSA